MLLLGNAARFAVLDILNARHSSGAAIIADSIRDLAIECCSEVLVAPLVATAGKCLVARRARATAVSTDLVAVLLEVRAGADRRKRRAEH